MDPDTHSQGGDVQAGHSPQQQNSHTATQAAAAQVIRSQIDALYGNAPQDATQQEAPNPYDRTHQPAQTTTASSWQEYHSAWQNYYQQYYQLLHEHNSKKAAPSATGDTSSYFSQTPPEEPVDTLDKDEALYELRQTLLGKVQHSAQKVRKSRHFIPIVAAIVVVLLFVFIQYNRLFVAWVSAYVSPGNIDVQNIVIDPSGNGAVSDDPRLIIPKINVDVPVVYDVGTDHDSQMTAMAQGVAHFPIPGANSHPGEKGNTVISGHSSNDLFDSGNYKFIFAQLERLNEGDTIYANYKGIRYTYIVTKKEVVRPNQVDKLVYATDKPVMTLITCTPLGTALNRLLITAEQISPDPAAAAPAPGTNTGSDTDAEMPGNAPTLFERLFGVR